MKRSVRYFDFFRLPKHAHAILTSYRLLLSVPYLVASTITVHTMANRSQSTHFTASGTSPNDHNHNYNDPIIIIPVHHSSSPSVGVEQHHKKKTSAKSHWVIRNQTPLVLVLLLLFGLTGNNTTTTVTAAVIPTVPLVPTSACTPASSRKPRAATAKQKRQFNRRQRKLLAMYGSNEQPAADEVDLATKTTNTTTATQATTTAPTSAPTSTAQAAPTTKTTISTTARDPIYLWSSLAAGVGSGALASVLCAPLDLVRTRMQVWGAMHTTSAGGVQKLGVVGMLRDIVQREGWKGCFRGLTATLVTVPAFWGVYFPAYTDFKRHFGEQYPTVNPAWVHMGSAVLAGAIADIICNPMFIVRTRLQTEALHHVVVEAGQKLLPPKTMIQTAQSLYKEGGPTVFWRGMSANLLGLSHVAIQFPVYEQLKSTFRQHKKHESALDLLLASGMSKMTASLVSYPHEVIRSRMMDARVSGGFAQTCRNIYAKEGMGGFYAGLPVSMIRVIPNTCITFLTYEMILRFAKQKIQDRRRNGVDQ